MLRQCSISAPQTIKVAEISGSQSHQGQRSWHGIFDHPLPVIPLPIVQPANKTVAAPQNKPGLQEAAAVHPIAVAIPIVTFAWYIAAWIRVAGDRKAGVSIVMVGFVNAMLFGLLAAGGWYSRNMTPGRATDRSFAAFVSGRVDIAKGRITGREALLQIAALSVVLAIGGTIIIAIAMWCGVGG